MRREPRKPRKAPRCSCRQHSRGRRRYRCRLTRCRRVYHCARLAGRRQSSGRCAPCFVVAAVPAPSPNSYAREQSLATQSNKRSQSAWRRHQGSFHRPVRTCCRVPCDARGKPSPRTATNGISSTVAAWLDSWSPTLTTTVDSARVRRFASGCDTAALPESRSCLRALRTCPSAMCA